MPNFLGHNAPGPNYLVLIHGMGRLRWSMAHLAPIARRYGYTPLLFEYRSKQGGIEFHANSLCDFLNKHIPAEVNKVCFICHSLGGIILQVASTLPDWRFTSARAVLLGPPNRGAKIAAAAARIPFAASYFGEPLRELSSWAPPVTSIEIGVVAGVLSHTKSLNPFLSEPNDTLVMVSETKLDGIKDHRIIRCPHAVMMYHPSIIKLSFRFLESGRFSSETSS